MRRTFLAALAFSLTTAVGVLADGMLDPSFGNGGLVVTNFPGIVTVDDAVSLVVLPDGRAVAAGTSNSIFDDDVGMAAARYLSSGALDASFGGDGMARVSCPPGFGFVGEAGKVLLQPDGRLVLIGYCTPGPVFWLVRLNTDGSFDPSFGTGGHVTTPFASGAWGNSGVLQPDGRIVAVGVYGSVHTGAARYNTDGSLDSTFGTGGTLTLIFPQGFLPRDVVLQPDGKLVIGGTFGQADFGLVRLLGNGALDSSFDGDGLATANFGGTETGDSLILLPDGRLVLGGLHNADFGLVRFLSDGSVDATFGTGGLATASNGGPVTPGEALVLPDGKLVIAGSTNLAGAPRDFLLARFLPESALDTSFGTAGFLRTDFAASEDSCFAVAVAGPDLILTAGAFEGGVPFTHDFALARYIASTPVELLHLTVD